VGRTVRCPPQKEDARHWKGESTSMRELSRIKLERKGEECVGERGGGKTLLSLTKLFTIQGGTAGDGEQGRSPQEGGVRTQKFKKKETRIRERTTTRDREAQKRFLLPKVHRYPMAVRGEKGDDLRDNTLHKRVLDVP